MNNNVNKIPQNFLSQKTTCPYCGVGCGVLVDIDEDGVVAVTGDPEHPANQGRLCSKGSALSETVYHNERLLYPEIMSEQVSWEQALSTTAKRFKETIEQYGKDSVAFYVSGQLLTEDYYLANKLMKGFIGSANIDTNSRLCMSSAVSGYKRAFGEDVVPCQYEDLEKAKLIVITGSNIAWCHPVLFQRIVKAKKDKPDLKIVVIDPRKTQTSSIADIHLTIKAGTDSFLFNGLLCYLDQMGEMNPLFVENHTRGVKKALKLARASSSDISQLAKTCGLERVQLEKFYQLFARTERTVSLYSQGINQSSSGTDKSNSIINCHLFTGRIGCFGMGPFSLTGQPNAMGGREVGGLSNQLAAHMEINSSAHRQLLQEFWQSPFIPKKQGLKAVDLFDAVEQGKIKAIWIMATNPVVSMPDADKVKAALKKCPLVVVSDCMKSTDTMELAHIRFPATTWGEKEGTVTNSERCISKQNPFIEAPGLARNDWWIISQIAYYMGFEKEFNYQHSVEIFREHCQLSAYKNNGERLFNLSAMSDISYFQYQYLKPTYWPCKKNFADLVSEPGIPSVKTFQSIPGERVFSTGHFSHKDHKACFIAIDPQLPFRTPGKKFPFRLNTGRVRDHWHTMTRTGMSPKLSSHTIEAYAEIHPQDAQKLDIADGTLVKISSPLKKHIIVRALLSNKQQPRNIFVPMHWNQQFSSQARVDSLIEAIVDPISGQPELKHAIVNIEEYQASWYGFLITRQPPILKYSSYWAKSRGKGLWRYELAGLKSPEDWSVHAHELLGDKIKNENWLEFYDKKQNHYRAIRMQGQRLESCLFIYSDIVLPPRDWLISLFHKENINEQERKHLLRAEPPSDQAQGGKIICSCFGAGEIMIKEAIKKHQPETVEALGELLQVGTNCGSCKPELAEFLKSKAKG